jgi:uncharacterized protein with HEPN domain
MYDKKLIFERLQKIEEALEHVLNRTRKISSVEDFMETPWGVDMLDVVCIRLEAVGETLKSIDRQSEGQLFLDYSSIPWKKIMGMRDIIAHHYFEVDADVVFNIVKNEIPLLLVVIKQMKAEMLKSI